ncbi:MAG: class I SAM-dependent methyltransferase [Acidobacteria bacterium]|nr:class I SAM-dependent methyltransferase [Acidobacteriota bacterium]
MNETLRQAEALEMRASTERVTYFSEIVEIRPGRILLDVGCGNGYAVQQWREAGLNAFGVDLSFYRLTRWVAEHRDSRPFVIADASALPFRDQSFEVLVSSGMIEHVGVSESANPYTIVPLPNRAEMRRSVVQEFVRVCQIEATVIVDFPNGSFPVDFWHGDSIGAFRVHPVPDVLLPSFSDMRSWAKHSGATARLKRLRGRLRFRQVGKHWWGKLFSPLMRVVIRGLDALSAIGLGRVVAPLYPYLVVQLQISNQR